MVMYGCFKAKSWIRMNVIRKVLLKMLMDEIDILIGMYSILRANKEEKHARNFKFPNKTLHNGTVFTNQ